MYVAMESRVILYAITAIICISSSTMRYNFYGVGASDPSPLQDSCVATNDPSSGVFVNGLLCKNPDKVTVQDFVYKGFNVKGDTNNPLNINISLVDVLKFPALNSQGIAVARLDFGPLGLNTPHHHPRASELFSVISGSLYAGFITSDNRLFSTILNAGDLFMFPQGLIHFQYNYKKTNAVAMTSFGSQHPGRVDIPQSLFGSTPSILDVVLKKAYQVDKDVIDQLRFQFSDALNVVPI